MTYAKGMAVEFAHKTTNGTVIEDALKALQEGKTTIDEVKALIEGGTVSNAKPIYWHTINFARGGENYTFTFVGHMIIINNSPTPITLTDFINLLKTPGFVGLVINGKCNPTASGNLENLTGTLLRIVYGNNDACYVYYYNGDNGNEQMQDNITISPLSFTSFNDLGANRIN